ncbi:unnamed protein product [marine sediment metagenome]|uniref:Cyclic nucleotide-binding domain-containing protein n=1 Tax=marine sediment metagenome TaxID=412755 RepID=X1UGF7_9ZZZZ
MKKENKKESVIHKITHPNILPRTFGEKAADGLTRVAGSWGFILSFAGFLVLWIIMNTTWLVFGSTWDARPFILLNLILSCLAAFQAPIILMSQNRTSQKDRQRAEYDYAVNRKAEREIQEIKKAMNRIEGKIMIRHKK